MEFLPYEARELMAYVREESFCPVGIVVLDDEAVVELSLMNV